MKTYLEVIKGMRELLSSEERWTRGMFCRDDQGLPAPIGSEQACAWCLAGAYWQTLYEAPNTPRKSGSYATLADYYLKLSNSVVGYTGRPGITNFNDNTDYLDVINFLDLIIAQEQARVQPKA